MKAIAFYLPQFHQIAENDKWWGEGFTDWVNVRKARPLFCGHDQPREPLDDRYYDLSKSDVMEWQAELAKKYGIYGFCYYHYYFSGKKLLEKPLEQMLANPKVQIPFCLCWANEPWARTWDGLDKHILIGQDYGEREEWVHHFNYLLPFFSDSRYIREDGKPVILIYRTESIKKVDEMIACWEGLGREHGFQGLHVVEMLNSFQQQSCSRKSSAVVEFEPMYTIKYGISTTNKIFNKLRSFVLYAGVNIKNYSTVWKLILSRKRVPIEGKKTYLGAFVNWDNTARKGKKGMLLTGFSLKRFSYFFGRQIAAARNNGSGFLFINAWNEWAEGTYLEPDKKSKFQVLQAIKEQIY